MRAIAMRSSSSVSRGTAGVTRLACVLVVLAVAGCASRSATPGSAATAGQYTPSAAHATTAASTSSPAPTPTALHGVFMPTGSMLAEAYDGVLLPDHTVLVVGPGAAQIYDPTSGRFHAVARPELTGVVIDGIFSDGRVLVESAAGQGLYDPGKNTYKPTGSSRYGYFNLGAVAIAMDGTHLLMVGGEGSYPDPSLPKAAEIYDESTGEFRVIGSFKTARDCPIAVRLQTGKVLVAGGNDGGECIQDSATYASAEVYDPATGKFTATGSMTVPRTYAQAILLNDGKVLVMGGRNDGDAANGNEDTAGQTAELYDPTNGTFTPTGSMAEPRTDFTATLLADGRVLVVCGLDHSGNVKTSAEIYDPATGIFSPTGPTAVVRYGHVSVRLVDGRVLIAGGGGSPQTAELYWP
jgi:hypothetical protein